MTRSLWEYSQARHIADDYDSYFAYNTLFEFDLALLERHFATPGRLVDLGCGTGRLLVPFAQRGYPTLAVDLSLPMLRVVGEKAAAAGVHIDRLQANMVELDCLADGCADYCIIMFSTLGMIRGHANRLAALRHARRILKPDGLFVCHVHNRWYNLFDPQGRRWLLASAWQQFRGQSEFGDKVVEYRGIPNMFLHVFTRTEFRALLAEAGFQVKEFTPLDTARRHALPCPWFLGRLRANGWIAVCNRA